MIVKNIGNEIVFVGDISLMPGDETVIANTIAQNPLVQVLANNGSLLLTEGSAIKSKTPVEKKTDVSVENADTAEADNASDKTVSQGKRGRKSAPKAE